MPDEAIAFAPASVGNVAVGFDVLGHSVQSVGDTVRARRIPERAIRIAAINGVVTGLPLEAGRNTAGVAVAALVEAVGLDHGFELTIEKGIPLGSGLGGSAASAVAAVVVVEPYIECSRRLGARVESFRRLPISPPRARLPTRSHPLRRSDRRA